MLYLLSRVFGSYTALYKPTGYGVIGSGFGVEDVEGILLGLGYSLEYNSYNFPASGLGGDCFPITFLSSITKTVNGAVLEYSYASADPDTCDEYFAVRDKKFKVTLGSNGSTRIQIKSVEVVE
jgi:hypothetical protein